MRMVFVSSPPGDLLPVLGSVAVLVLSVRHASPPRVSWRVSFRLCITRTAGSGLCRYIRASAAARFTANQPSPVRNYCGLAFWTSLMTPKPSADVPASVQELHCVDLPGFLAAEEGRDPVLVGYQGHYFPGRHGVLMGLSWRYIVRRGPACFLARLRIPRLRGGVFTRCGRNPELPVRIPSRVSL